MFVLSHKAESLDMSVKNLIKICNKLCGLKKNTSMHAAGVVISDINLNDQEARFYLEDGTEVTSINNSYVVTGMKMRVNDEEYILVVRGDINGDGRISIVDLSKHIAHYAEIPGFTLEGASEKAGDINLDGEFTLIDVSQLLKIYNEM